MYEKSVVARYALGQHIPQNTTIAIIEYPVMDFDFDIVCEIVTLINGE